MKPTVHLPKFELLGDPLVTLHCILHTRQKSEHLGCTKVLWLNHCVIHPLYNDSFVELLFVTIQPSIYSFLPDRWEPIRRVERIRHCCVYSAGRKFCAVLVIHTGAPLFARQSAIVCPQTGPPLHLSGKLHSAFAISLATWPWCTCALNM